MKYPLKHICNVKNNLKTPANWFVSAWTKSTSILRVREVAFEFPGCENPTELTLTAY